MKSKLTLAAIGLGRFFTEADPALQQPWAAQLPKFNDTTTNVQPYVEPQGNASINTTDTELPTSHSTVGSTVVRLPEFNNTNTTTSTIDTSTPSAAADSFDNYLTVLFLLPCGVAYIWYVLTIPIESDISSENEQVFEESDGAQFAP